MLGIFRSVAVACWLASADVPSVRQRLGSAERSMTIAMTSQFEQSNRHVEEMVATAQRISRRGHGILATDESVPTAGKRLETIGMANNEANRRSFREMLYTTEGLGEYISGVILFDEAMHQRTADGALFTERLRDEGIAVGIKVDTGLQPLAGTNGETLTQGLDGLGERCRAYYRLGARFAKWRAVLKIGEGMPSERAISSNAASLGRYASICQECGLVPIIEPEITLGPGDYSVERAAYESEKVLSHVVRALNTHDVILEATLLKASMVLPGLDASIAENDKDQVARLTTRSLMRTVPPAVPGVHFLSGGMGAEEATMNLQAMQRACPNAPWALSFSFGRAIQDGVIKAWSGEATHVKEAQALLLELARVNAEASMGVWDEVHPVPGTERMSLPKLSFSSERRVVEGASSLFNW